MRGDHDIERGIFTETARRSRDEYSPIITEPEANDCLIFLHNCKSFVFFGTEFILLFRLFLYQYNVHKTASRNFATDFGLLYSAVGEYQVIKFRIVSDKDYRLGLE